MTETIAKQPTMPVDRNGVAIQEALSPTGGSQVVAFTDVHAESDPITASVVRMVATQDCHVAFVENGSPEVATVYDMLFKANQPAEYFRLRTPTMVISAIRDTVSGDLYITAME